MRVGLILSNQVLVTKDPQTGQLRGVTVSLGKSLAKRIGVPFEPVGYPNPAALVQSFGRNEWDIAFLAIDPVRARDVDFSPPYMVVDNTYLVPVGSQIRNVEMADQPGVKIAVPERSAPNLFLSRNLKAAEIIRVPGGADAAIEVLRSGRADAYAENAHMLSLYSDRLPGSRVLEGRYTLIQHAVATPKGRSAADSSSRSPSAMARFETRSHRQVFGGPLWPTRFQQSDLLTSAFEQSAGSHALASGCSTRTLGGNVH